MVDVTPHFTRQFLRRRYNPWGMHFLGWGNRWRAEAQIENGFQSRVTAAPAQNITSRGIANITEGTTKRVPVLPT